MPPTVNARPLPISKRAHQRSEDHLRTLNLQGHALRTRSDDTPKAFRRLMAFQKTGKRPDGLDDDNRGPRNGKTKRNEMLAQTSAVTAPRSSRDGEIPIIRPDEHMSDFGARVNRHLPISGLVNNKKVDGARQSQTRTEKKIQRKINSWREEQARRKDREEEARDLAVQDDAIDSKLVESRWLERLDRKKRLRRPESDDDPWAKLNLDRGQRLGLRDVAQAPPTFRTTGLRKLKVNDGAAVDVANVPTKAGSMRKREHLQVARSDIIKSYRNRMNGRRHGGSVD